MEIGELIGPDDNFTSVARLARIRDNPGAFTNKGSFCHRQRRPFRRCGGRMANDRRLDCPALETAANFDLTAIGRA